MAERLRTSAAKNYAEVGMSRVRAKGESRFTKGAAKMKLVDHGIGCWTKHADQWCVRIAGDCKAGDHVQVMANAGRVTKLILGDPIRNTRFQWRNSDGERIDGQLFHAVRITR